LARLHLGDDAGVAFAEGLISDSTVHTVDLKNNKFGAKSGAALARVLGGRGTSGLRKMLLDDNDFGDSWKELVPALAAHRSLEELSLHRCKLSDEAGAAFAEGLVKESKLHTVNLDDNHLCGAAGAALVQALRRGAASGLCKLTLENNDLGPDAVTELKAAWANGSRDPNELKLDQEQPSLCWGPDPCRTPLV